jgi:hypothetical protein
MTDQTDESTEVTPDPSGAFNGYPSVTITQNGVEREVFYRPGDYEYGWEIHFENEPHWIEFVGTAFDSDDLEQQITDRHGDN